MRNFLILTTLAFSLLTSSADVLIYRAVEKAKSSGSGEEWDQTYFGYWIVDLNANPGTNVMAIHRYTSGGQKLYYNNSIPVLFTQIKAKQPFSILATGLMDREFVYDQQPWLLNMYLKGKNKNLKIATARNGSYPQTMDGSLLQAGPDGSEVAAVEVHLSLSYQQSMTVTNNTAGNDAQTILNEIASQMENDGYRRAD